MPTASLIYASKTGEHRTRIQSIIEMDFLNVAGKRIRAQRFQSQTAPETRRRKGRQSSSGHPNIGYSITITVDCKSMQDRINEWCTFLNNSGGKPNIVKRGSKLATHGMVNFDFDAFEAVAEYWICPTGQPDITYEDPVEKEEDVPSFEKDQALTTNDFAELLTAAASRRRTNRKPPRKIIKPNMTNFLKGDPRGKLTVKFYTIHNRCPVNQVTMHFLAYSFASMVAAKPFDPLDDLGRMRSGRGGDTPVNDLLRSLDGVLEHNVSLVATSNQPHVLDPALLRPGRLSPIIIFGPPNKDSREHIVKIYLEKVQRGGYATIDLNGDLPKIVEQTDGFTGADIKEVIDSVLYQQLGNGTTEFRVTAKAILKIVRDNREQKVARNTNWTNQVTAALEGQAQFSMIYH